MSLERTGFCDGCRVPLYEHEISRLYEHEISRLYGLSLCGTCWLRCFEAEWRRRTAWHRFCPRFARRQQRHCVNPCARPPPHAEQPGDSGNCPRA